MELKVKKHNKHEFHDIFAKWLESQNFPYIAKEVLPENVFVAYVDDVPCYCLWFYHTDSQMAQVGWPASNKNVSKKHKDGAFKYLYEQVSKYAKRKKYLRLFTTSATQSVIDTMLSAGYVEGEECKHYFKILE